MPNEIATSFAGPFSWFGASDASVVYCPDAVRQCGIYLWTVPLTLGRLGPVGKIRCMIVLSAIFYFPDGNRFVRGAGRVVRASGFALLDTSREPRDGGAGF